jgi:hypothetical protein
MNLLTVDTEELLLASRCGRTLARCSCVSQALAGLCGLLIVAAAR